jgi:electron transport complex protein RnfE
MGAFSMIKGEFRKIVRDGLWNNNQALVALLGLCPLLAISTTLVNALGLGVATTLTLVLSSLIVSLIRGQIKREIRLPVFVLVIACAVTAIELCMSAFFHELYRVLGIFIPLIVTNCAIVGRAEVFASRSTPDKAALDGFCTGLGFTFALVALGGMREVIGSGTLFARADLLFGEAARNWLITIFQDYQGFLLAILPPGAFIGLGFLVAMKNVIDGWLRKPATSQKRAPSVAASSR